MSRVLVADRATGRGAGNPADRDAWIRSRFEAALAYVTANALGSGAAANGIALCALSLWANETGWGAGSSGAGEHHWNVGNVHAEATYNGNAVSVRGRRGTEYLRTYASLADGVTGWFEFVRDHYPTAFGMLRAGDLAYWAQLQRDGYGGGINGAGAVAIYNRCALTVGVAAMDTADEAAELGHWAAIAGESRGSASSVSVGPVVGVVAVAVLGRIAGVW